MTTKNSFQFSKARVAAAALIVPLLAGVPTPVHALANPASVFCVQSGGRTEILTSASGGQFGVCILPDGQLVEEWAYFRSHSRPQTAPSGK